MIHRDPSPFAPLPGTTPAPRALFIDLWGSLLYPPQEGFARRFEAADLAPGGANALFRATQAGWNVYLLGNQPAVARGLVSEEEWTTFERAVLTHLSARGVAITRTYFCIDDPIHGVPGRQRDSVYALPNTGAFFHASHTDGVELRNSWVVGDSTAELVAGWRAGLRTVGLRSGLALSDALFDVTPDFVAPHLGAAVLELLELEGAIHP